MTMQISGEKCIEHSYVGHEPAMHITELCIYPICTYPELVLIQKT